MKTTNGDLIVLLLDGEFDVIVHGCNCFCTMGAGLAKSIALVFPQALAADLSTKKGEVAKLGNYTKADCVVGDRSVTIINAYTQFDYRGSGIRADYNAIREVFKKLKAAYSGKRFGIPLIGAGLAGGDWKIISEIISTELEGEDCTLVKYNT